MHRFPLYFTMVIFGLLAFSSQAFAAADITLDRNPAPPQQVPKDGSGVVSYNFTINYDSDPDRAQVIIRNLGGTIVDNRTIDLEGQSRNSSGSGLLAIPQGNPSYPAGTYTIDVLYYTDTNFGGCGAAGPNSTPNSPSACVEDQAEVTFEVVDNPSLILTKFNDLNRNGVQDAGEPVLSDWTFTGTGPNVNGNAGSTGVFTTDTTGRIVLSGLAVNSNYSFTEHVKTGWEVIGQPTQSTTIFAGQTSQIKFANAIIDVCSNIAGAQTTVPAGMIQDGTTCVTPPPTDVCPNITGAQATVPAGMIVVAGNCVTPPPTDVCPNIDGAQGSVPAGMIVVAGNCVTPPVTDVCSNIAGAQGSVPGGFYVSGTQCLPVVHGTAVLHSHSGCQTRSYYARVTGREIASVTFYIDGKKIKTVHGASASLKVVPTKYKKGIHRVNAVVTFVTASETAPKTVKSTFFRCIKPTPKFTG